MTANCIRQDKEAIHGVCDKGFPWRYVATRTYILSTAYIPSYNVLGIGSCEDCFPNSCNSINNYRSLLITFWHGNVVRVLGRRPSANKSNATNKMLSIAKRGQTCKMVYVVHYVWTLQAHAGFGRETTTRREMRGATLGMDMAETDKPGNQHVLVA